MPALKDKYTAEVAPALMSKFGYTSPMEIPKIVKVVVNCGVGEAKENTKVLDSVVNDIATITGQKPIVTKAKKSVANFKLREGMPMSATSSASAQTPLMAAATMPWASRNS